MKVLREELEVSTVDNCTILVSPNGDMAIMNETASFIMGKTQTSSSWDEVISQTRNYYGVDSSTIRQDLDDLLDILKSHSLLAEAWMD